MTDWQAARDRIEGDSWIDDLARASLSAAGAKFGPVRPAGPITVPHQIGLCYSSPLHCHMHEVDELCVPGYRWCLECGHTFATAAELLAGHNEHLAVYGIPPETDPGNVTCCPACTHDW